MQNIWCFKKLPFIWQNLFRINELNNHCWLDVCGFFYWSLSYKIMVWTLFYFVISKTSTWVRTRVWLKMLTTESSSSLSLFHGIARCFVSIFFSIGLQFDVQCISRVSFIRLLVYMRVRGFANFFLKNPRLLWKWVQALLRFFCWKSSQNSPKSVLIFWSSIPCVLYTLIKVVCYYDLSVLSMSVMSFQKKSLVGGG